MNIFKIITAGFIMSTGVLASSQAGSVEADEMPPSAHPLPSFSEAQKTQLQRLGLCETYADGDDFFRHAPLSLEEKSTPPVVLEHLIRNAIANKHPLSIIETHGPDLMVRVQLGRGPANFSLQNWRSSQVATSILSQITFLLQIRF